MIDTKIAPKFSGAPHLCGTETPSVFERRVQKGYASDKTASLCPQSGRSMIEMLGVLAIIGVLSIGGIAGYSKAMTKYRINKTADQITQLAQNIRTLFASQKNYEALGSSSNDRNKTYELIKKAHLAPEEMYEYTSGEKADWLFHPFGGWVSVMASSKYSNADRKAFYISVYDIPQEACIELLTMDWGNGSASGLIALGYGAAVHEKLYGCSGEDDTQATCAGDGVMPVDKAIQICQYPWIDFKFY